MRLYHQVPPQQNDPRNAPVDASELTFKLPAKIALPLLPAGYSKTQRKRPHSFSLLSSFGLMQVCNDVKMLILHKSETMLNYQSLTEKPEMT